MKKKDKWRFAIGTTSRVPGSREKLHYLIADFDGPLLCRPYFHKLVTGRGVKTVAQSTPHGWHIYTNLQMSFDKLIRVLTKIGADPAWIQIGKSRGYYFLADKDYVYFPWPVEHMAIHHGKKEA